jgi:uncharacterized protein (TIGR00730 family)
MELATELGETLADKGLRLVYGGGGLGLMGAVARAAHDAGGRVLGVIPDILRKVEATLSEIEHDFVPDMHTRKINMYDASDAFIILPGGIGTLEEAIEVMSWQQLNLHSKPIVFLSNTGYWDGLMDELIRMIEAGFARPSMAMDLLRAETVQQAFEVLEERLSNPIERPELVLRDVSVGTLA